MRERSRALLKDGRVTALDEDDVAQEVLVVYLMRIRRDAQDVAALPRKRQGRTVARTAHLTLNGVIRSEKRGVRSSRRVLSLKRLRQAVASERDCPCHRAVLEETRRIIVDVLSKLPDEHAALIVVVYVCGISVTELAGLCGVHRDRLYKRVDVARGAFVRALFRLAPSIAAHYASATKNEERRTKNEEEGRESMTSERRLDPSRF